MYGLTGVLESGRHSCGDDVMTVVVMLATMTIRRFEAKAPKSEERESV